MMRAGWPPIHFIIPTTILLALTQGLGAKISIVSGQGLGELIRKKFGVRLSVAIFLLYFVVNQGVVLQNVSGLKSAFQLFGLPWQAALIFTSALLSIIVVTLNFKKLQRLFLVMILFYFAYVISAILANPNWGEALRESLILPRKINIWDVGYWFSLVAVLGTTVTAWGQFFISSFIVDKGLTIENLKDEKIEIYVGAFLTNFFSWMIALSVTYTLFVHSIRVEDGYAAALAIRPFAGQFASALFAGGLFGASLLGLTIVPLATSYAFTELFGYERTLNASFKTGKTFYIFFIIQLVFGIFITLFPQINLFKLTLYADYLNGAMLPIIFYFLITFSESKEIMGEYATKGIVGWFIRLAAVVITVVVATTMIGKIFL
jgi:Mn2+/Fe2+ NRAMP family transporter